MIRFLIKISQKNGIVPYVLSTSIAQNKNPNKLINIL